MRLVFSSACALLLSGAAHAGPLDPPRLDPAQLQELGDDIAAAMDADCTASLTLNWEDDEGCGIFDAPTLTFDPDADWSRDCERTLIGGATATATGVTVGGQVAYTLPDGSMWLVAPVSVDCAPATLTLSHDTSSAVAADAGNWVQTVAAVVRAWW